MGVRFEYGARRATNGPMIFFSDPVSEINLKEEIRGAIDARLSFYAYRMPGDMLFSFGSSESIVEGIGEPGFVIAPFDPLLPPLTIPYRQIRPDKPATSFNDTFPTLSTTPEEHRREVLDIKEMLNGIGRGKVVAAKVSVGTGSVDLGATFLELSRNYPDAFIYCFGSPATGCWIGATPELLLRGTGSGLETMALAGTRRAYSEGDWDIKNLEEQEMVTEYITNALTAQGLNPSAGATFAKRAGTIEHLCTPITTSGTVTSPGELEDLLHTLSPTPALCGLPRREALDIIGSCEKFDRSFYGGFCGPFHSVADFSLYVTIRCARIAETRYAIYAGGGITHLSDPAEEWEEACLKTDTVRSFLQYNP